MSTTPNNKSLKPVRGNQFFLKRGHEKHLEYQKTLAKGQNPDHKSRYPNECVQAQKKDFVELTKRVNKEWESMLNVQAMRLRKHTGPRRIQA